MFPDLLPPPKSLRHRKRQQARAAEEDSDGEVNTKGWAVEASSPKSSADFSENERCEQRRHVVERSTHERKREHRSWQEATFGDVINGKSKPSLPASGTHQHLT